MCAGRWRRGGCCVEAPRDAVTQLGLGVRKVAAHANDVARGIVDHIREDEPDLVVMATHQRSGTDRWLHGALAEPVARQAGVKTLFVPRQTPGFISPETGQVALRTVLIPVDRRPIPSLRSLRHSNWRVFWGQAAPVLSFSTRETRWVCRNWSCHSIRVGPTENIQLGPAILWNISCPSRRRSRWIWS